MNRQRPSKSSTFPYSRHEIGTADFTVPRRLPSGWGIGRRQEATTNGLWRSAASPIRKGQSWWKQKHILAENKYGPKVALVGISISSRRAITLGLSAILKSDLALRASTSGLPVNRPRSAARCQPRWREFPWILPVRGAREIWAVRRLQLESGGVGWRGLTA